LSIEIAYALVGNSINPQKKILKVAYNWKENEGVAFVLKVSFILRFCNLNFISEI
jgi:hypothetical protein